MDHEDTGQLHPDAHSLRTHRRTELLYSRNVLVLEMYQPDLPAVSHPPLPPMLPPPVPGATLKLMDTLSLLLRQNLEFVDVGDEVTLATEDDAIELEATQESLDPLVEHRPEQYSTILTPLKSVFGDDATAPALAPGLATGLVLGRTLRLTPGLSIHSRFDATDDSLAITQPVFHRIATSTPTPQLSNLKLSTEDLSPLDHSIMKGLDDLDFEHLSHDEAFSRVKVDGGMDLMPELCIKPVYNVDQLKETLKLPVDIYGFKKVLNLLKFTAKEYNEWFGSYAHYTMRRRQKWEHLLRHNGLLFDSNKPPLRFPPKSDKVKKLIRRGIPPEWRGNAWFFYAGGYEKLNKHVGVYEKIVKDTQGIQNKDTEVIERDLNRTFPDNIYFNENCLLLGTVSPNDLPGPETGMIKALRRVLVAFAHYQPQIGYCQLLNFLAGLLLLFMDEERAFWMLVILTERIIPKVHLANLEGVHTDQGVLMLCIKEYIPRMWTMLGKNMEGEQVSEDKILSRLPPVTLVTSLWFMLVFVGIMPIETVLRVWDILWYEGSKTLFRISLTVCNMCLEQEQFRSSSQNIEQIELFQFMQSYPKLILDPNQLIDNCFKKIGGYGFGSLSQDEINNCREFVKKQREKINQRKLKGLLSDMSAEEQRTLIGDEDIHDVYGFNRSLMSGVVWNRQISTKMKKKFAMKKR